MIIKEFRVLLPISVEEYQVGQLYAVAEASKNETGGGEGVKVLSNKPYEENGEKGQYTYKIYYLQSKVPKLIRLLAPKESLEIHEEAWNAYPYCRTILTNKYMGVNFYIKIETWHKPDMGEQENVHGLDAEAWKKTEVVHIDIADRTKVGAKDYKPDQDPATFVSKKTNRGPLGPNWKQELRLFTNFHRQLFCSLDQWVELSMDDIRLMEEETQKELDKMRADGELKGTIDDDNN